MTHTRITALLGLVFFAGASLAQNPQAELIAPQTAEAGTEITVSWTGPNDRGDFVVIAPAMAVPRWYGQSGAWESTARGSDLRIVTPARTGTYQLRYVHWESETVLATRAILVEPSQHSPMGPQNVEPEAAFQIDWTGYQDNPGEFFIMPIGGGGYADDQSDISRDRIGFTRDNDAFYFQAPRNPGAYRLHYRSAADGSFLWSRNLFVGDTFFGGGYSPYDAWGYGGYRGDRDRGFGRDFDRGEERYGDRERDFDLGRHPAVRQGLEVGARGQYPAGGGYPGRYYDRSDQPLVIHPAGTLRVTGYEGTYRVMNDQGLIVAEGDIGGEPVGLLVGRYQVVVVDAPGLVKDVIIGTATESQVRF